MARKYDEPHFIMPGGRIKEGETPEQALKRELKEELNVDLVSMEFFKSWQAPHFRDKDKIVKMDTYFVKVQGNPKPGREINEIKWIDSKYKEKGIQVASINEDFLIPQLKAKGLID